MAPNDKTLEQKLSSETLGDLGEVKRLCEKIVDRHGVAGKKLVWISTVNSSILDRKTSTPKKSAPAVTADETILTQRTPATPGSTTSGSAKVDNAIPGPVTPNGKRAASSTFAPSPVAEKMPKTPTSSFVSMMDRVAQVKLDSAQKKAQA